MGTLIPACEKCAGLVHGKGGDKGAGRSEVPVSASQAVRGIEMSAEDRESLRAKEGMDGSNDWAEDAEIRVLATKAMRSLVDSKDALSGQARGMIKSPSFEMLENYRKQPLHVRSRAEQWELLPSEIILKERLGEGDGGIIHCSAWRGLDVVAKMLKTQESDPNGNICHDVAKADLINEISILSRLRHPNLVMFLGACTIGEPMIILNEFMAGGNLEDYLLNKKREKGGKPWIPPLKTVLQWSVELARALCFLHNCTPVIIHRDLKPANLLLNEDGHLKVGDFGLSKVKELQKIAGTYRMTGKTGSMRYMAPEVFQDDPNYDEKVDIYSTGLILWYIALGERPFDRVPAEVVAENAVQAGLRPDLNPIRRIYGEVFADLVARCWHANPASRPSGNELVDALEDAGLILNSKSKKDSARNCCIS